MIVQSKELMTPAQVCELVGFSEKSLRIVAQKGELPAICVSRDRFAARPVWRFRRADVMAWLEDRTVRVGPPPKKKRRTVGAPDLWPDK